MSSLNLLSVVCIAFVVVSLPTRDTGRDKKIREGIRSSYIQKRDKEIREGIRSSYIQKRDKEIREGIRSSYIQGIRDTGYELVIPFLFPYFREYSLSFF